MTRLKFKTERHKGFTVLRAYDARTHEETAYYELQRVTLNGRKYTRVAFAEVTRPGEGIGTKVYERAAQLACRARAPLASDKTRTIYSNNFWEKQVKKGRATCVVRGGGVKLEADTFAPKGRWSCGSMALSCPAPRSLAGMRGR